MEDKYRVIGVMSGTSLDGLDIAYCSFFREGSPPSRSGTWKFKIHNAVTIKYSRQWRQKLSTAFGMKKADLSSFDKEYGRFIATEVINFLRSNRLSVDFIASHGHTVFHRPEKGITLQIGSGEQLAALVGQPIVCDFRSGDVALGGQGAPLVPVADRMLFSKYACCLNLGGFANISFDKKDKRIAFDICPVNIVLNDLAATLGKEFDKGGKLASQGTVHEPLLKKLNALPFYKGRPPKSLGREWVERSILPLLNSFKISIKDKLSTVTEHAAIQIAAVVNASAKSKNDGVLITGGGAYNEFLIDRIAYHTACKIVLPDDKTIQFKEAMAFAFLGVLKMRGEINILKSVTGAKKDSSGGRIFLPG